MAPKQPKSLQEEFGGNAVPLTSNRPMLKWDEPGQRLRGKFLGIKDGSLDNQRILMLEDKDGALQVSCPMTLEDALTLVKPGSEVVIQYDGEQPSTKRAGKTFKTFQVVMLKA